MPERSVNGTVLQCGLHRWIGQPGQGHGTHGHSAANEGKPTSIPTFPKRITRKRRCYLTVLEFSHRWSSGGNQFDVLIYAVLGRITYQERAGAVRQQKAGIKGSEKDGLPASNSHPN